MKSAPFRRRSPLDGLKPTDFDPNWPHGRFTIPQGLLDNGLTPAQAEVQANSVRLIRQLARDLVAYVGATDSTQQVLATRCGINAAAITRLRRGQKFPGLTTFLALRTQVPTEQQVEDGLLEGRKPAPQRPQSRPVR
ncbi:hypothetical protein [Nocardioides sp. AX2bis]|uniref:hypothetical protein n=1 Tax=Nocardioides sp. AX2bis TaxID=2653157 RepID=UPI0012F31014|nr:hypothetical protein [Nocardioides sp. AX2bis]VXC26687.1 hypothetical protein NOCARDAX2BIS_490076 [Nocardioides sp. AX2bis]